MKNLNLMVRGLLLALALLLALLARQAMVWGSGWPTNYEHFQQIRADAKAIRKGTPVKFTLNDGTIVRGELLRYEAYTDYVWYQPEGTRSWFAQDAFDVHELFRLDVLAEEPL